MPLTAPFYPWPGQSYCVLSKVGMPWAPCSTADWTFLASRSCNIVLLGKEYPTEGHYDFSITKQTKIHWIYFHIICVIKLTGFLIFRCKPKTSISLYLLKYYIPPQSLMLLLHDCESLLKSDNQLCILKCITKNWLSFKYRLEKKTLLEEFLNLNAKRSNKPMAFPLSILP